MSDEIAPRREEKKALSRRRILESARFIFFRDGFMKANLDEVARGAGVAKGTLYRYFESKAELYVAVLSEDGSIFVEKMRATLSPELTAADQIRCTGRFYFDHWTHNRQYFQIFWAIENESLIGGLPSQVVGEVTMLWESCLKIMADVVERGVQRGEFRDCDSWQISNILWTTCNGLLAIESSEPLRRLMRGSLEGVFESALENFLRGIARTVPAG
ncbi:TetR/AcrR family transcriptional regulator [Myxococcota bacterium]|nr:TetR/AcrR family transcriptional regulator [Myxococcota bacterium]